MARPAASPETNYRAKILRKEALSIRDTQDLLPWRRRISFFIVIIKFVKDLAERKMT